MQSCVMFEIRFRVDSRQITISLLFPRPSKWHIDLIINLSINLWYPKNHWEGNVNEININTCLWVLGGTMVIGYTCILYRVSYGCSEELFKIVPLSHHPLFGMFVTIHSAFSEITNEMSYLFHVLWPLWHVLSSPNWNIVLSGRQRLSCALGIADAHEH